MTQPVPILGIYPKELKSTGIPAYHVYGGITHNSQNMEPAWVPIHR